MLIIELRVNDRVIKTIGVLNVHPHKLLPDFQGECPYQIFNNALVNDENYIGALQHKRSDGAEILAIKALELVAKANRKGYEDTNEQEKNIN